MATNSRYNAYMLICLKNKVFWTEKNAFLIICSSGVKHAWELKKVISTQTLAGGKLRCMRKCKAIKFAMRLGSVFNSNPCIYNFFLRRINVHI